MSSSDRSGSRLGYASALEAHANGLDPWRWGTKREHPVGVKVMITQRAHQTLVTGIDGNLI